MADFGTLFSLVAGLLLASSPATIPRLIVAIIVDPFNGQSSRAMPHVIKEIPEILPTLANADSTPAIVFIANMFRIDTAFEHAAPYSIFRPTRTPATSRTMLKRNLIILHPPPLANTVDLSSKTAAALGTLATQARTPNDTLGSAIALAGPLSFSGCVIEMARYNEPSSELLARKINQTVHSYPLRRGCLRSHAFQRHVGLQNFCQAREGLNRFSQIGHKRLRASFMFELYEFANGLSRRNPFWLRT